VATGFMQQVSYTEGVNTPEGRGDLPLAAQVANDLRERIRQGEWRRGQRLPTEYELAESYGVERSTVRRAMALLKAEALIDSRKGSGSFVRQPPVRFRFTRHGLPPGVRPWEHATSRAGVDGSARLTSMEQLSADAEVAAHLGIAEGSPVIVRRGEMLAGDTVAQLFSAWYPLSLVAGTELAINAAIPDGIYAALDRAGLGVDTVTDEIGARPPTPEEAESLHLAPGVPVLTLTRTAYAADRPVEYVQTVSNPEMLLFAYEHLPLGQPETSKRRRAQSNRKSPLAP
jgi:GntR family transcriptional regulator